MECQGTKLLQRQNHAENGWEETPKIGVPSPYQPGRGNSWKREEIYPLPEDWAELKWSDTERAACEALALSRKNANKLTHVRQILNF